MATPGELCSRMADLLGLNRNATAAAWRVLRDAGQVTSGGRGRSAAHCEAADASKLLTAAVGKLPLLSTERSWERFSNLPENSFGAFAERHDGLPDELKLLPAPHTFQEALAALFAAAVSGTLQRFLAQKVNPDDLYIVGHVSVKFLSPYPQTSIAVHKNGEKGHIGVTLKYSDMPDTDLTPEGLDQLLDHFGSSPACERGDLRQISIVTERTIVAIGELLRERGRGAKQ